MRRSAGETLVAMQGDLPGLAGGNERVDQRRPALRREELLRQPGRLIRMQYLTDLAGIVCPKEIALRRARAIVKRDEPWEPSEHGWVPEILCRNGQHRRRCERVVGWPGRDPVEQRCPGLLGPSLIDPLEH